MFEIRGDVAQQMREEAIGDNRRHIEAALKHDHPDLASRWSNAQLTRLVDYAIDRADEYGLHSERSIFVFCCAMFTYGLQFDTDSRHDHWTRDVLDDLTLEEDIKRSLLEYRIQLDTGRDV